MASRPPKTPVTVVPACVVRPRASRGKNRPFVGDDLLQLLDAIVGESRDSMFTDPVDSQAAIVGEHVHLEFPRLKRCDRGGDQNLHSGGFYFFRTPSYGTCPTAFSTNGAGLPPIPMSHIPSVRASSRLRYLLLDIGLILE
jgi:hypothetical protein